MKLKLAIAVAALLAAGALKADTVWDVSGNISTSGSNGSSVSIDYSYVLDIAPIPNTSQMSYVTSNASVEGSGTMGNNWTFGGFIPTEVNLDGPFRPSGISDI